MEEEEREEGPSKPELLLSAAVDEERGEEKEERDRKREREGKKKRSKGWGVL